MNACCAFMSGDGERTAAGWCRVYFVLDRPAGPSDRRRAVSDSPGMAAVPVAATVRGAAGPDSPTPGTWAPAATPAPGTSASAATAVPGPWPADARARIRRTAGRGACCPLLLPAWLVPLA